MVERISDLRKQAPVNSGGSMARPGVPCRPRNYYDHQHPSTVMTLTEPKQKSSDSRMFVVSFEPP